jgi:trans-aconitate methyltransferase
MTVARSEQWLPDIYDRRAAFVSASGADLIDLLAPRPGEWILDLGCGTGVLTEKIAQKGARVLGVDYSEPMLAAARKQFPHLAFEQADGQQLQFNTQFDAVFSNAALHWMCRAEDVVAGIARALKAGGRLVLEMGGRGNVGRILAAVSAALQSLDITSEPYCPWYFPSLGEYASLLERHGLEVTWACLFERPSAVDDDETESGLATWLRMFAPDLLLRVGERKEELIRRAEAHCRPAQFRDGAWYIDYVRLRMLARKPSHEPAPT